MVGHVKAGGYGVPSLEWKEGVDKMQPTLAIRGGTPVRTESFPSWPIFDQTDEEALLRVLRSGKRWQIA